MISNVQVSAKMVRPFLQDKWFWWVDLDDHRYAYGESPSYVDVLGEMSEALKKLDEESGEEAAYCDMQVDVIAKVVLKEDGDD